jgi:hypothetical protein
VTALRHYYKQGGGRSQQERVGHVVFAEQKALKYWRDTNLLLHVQIMPPLPLDPALCKSIGNGLN